MLSGSEGSPSDSDRTSSTSSFSLHLSSGGASDISLLTEDVVLERLERTERSLIAVRDIVIWGWRAACGEGKNNPASSLTDLCTNFYSLLACSKRLLSTR